MFVFLSMKNYSFSPEREGHIFLNTIFQREWPIFLILQFELFLDAMNLFKFIGNKINREIKYDYKCSTKSKTKFKYLIDSS